MKYPRLLQQWSIQRTYLHPRVETGETIWGGESWHSPQLPSTQNGSSCGVRIKMCHFSVLILYGPIIHAVI